MYDENKTMEHSRDPNGRVNDTHPRSNRRKSSGFLAYVTTALALCLVVTGLLLHASMQSNAANLQKIHELEQTHIAHVTEMQEYRQEEVDTPRPEATTRPQWEPVLPIPVEVYSNCEDGECETRGS